MTKAISKGSVQLRHRKGCKATGKDSRSCRCGPTAYAVLQGKWERIGYLPGSWRKADLEPFEDRLREMREAFETGQPFRRPKATRLSDYAEGWFDELENAAKAGLIAKATFNAYESYWHNHISLAFGHLPLAAIDQPMIRRYVAAKLANGLKPNTVNNTLTMLSAALTDAVADSFLAANPVCQPRRGRHGGRRRAIYARTESPQPKHLEPDEARALLAATEPEHYPMVFAALTTGLRRGELRGLKWQDLAWGQNRIAVRGQLLQTGEYEPCKHDSARNVVLYSGLARILGRHRQAEGWVFTKDGKPLTDWQQRKALEDAFDAAKLSRHLLWHKLRHTYSSVLENAGIPRAVIEVLLGHSPRGVTAIYTHPFKDAFEAVEEALDGVFGVNEASTDASVTTENQEQSDPTGMAASPLVEPGDAKATVIGDGAR
jgi:integrase